jgi:hypothetical protein
MATCIGYDLRFRPMLGWYSLLQISAMGYFIIFKWLIQLWKEHRAHLQGKSTLQRNILPVFKAGLLCPEISYQTNVVGILLQYMRHYNGLTINYTLLSDTANLLYVIMYATCFDTSRKVAVSIPDGITEIFHWQNPSGSTMVLGFTQPLTELSTRNISWEVKAAGA